MQKKIVSLLQYLLFLGLGLFLIWYQLREMSEQDKASFFNAFKQANYWLVLPIVLMSLFSHFCRAQRWRLMMEPMGYKPTIYNTFCVTMVGYLANAGVPRLGEVLKCTFLSRYEKIPVNKLVGTILVERMFDLLCFACVIGLTFLVEFNVVSNFMSQWLVSKNESNYSNVILFFAGILLLIVLLRFLVKKYPKNKVVVKFTAIIQGIKEGFFTVLRLKKRRSFLIWTVLMWAMYLLQIYVGFFAMDTVAGLGIGAAMAVLVLASLSMIITPGGMGTFPLFIMEVLLLYDVSRSHGKAFGWLMWGVSTCIVIFGGLVCLIILPYINKKKHA